MPRFNLTPDLLERLAERFRALGETSRLRILTALLAGERSVSQLMEETGLGQANLSKHLNVLHQQGFVIRRKEGLNVLYRLTDEEVFRICDLMCGKLEREARSWTGLLQPRRVPLRTPKAKRAGSR
jgi:DNA-binding transcriptional ArsR family regulator